MNYQPLIDNMLYYSANVATGTALATGTSGVVDSDNQL